MELGSAGEHVEGLFLYALESGLVKPELAVFYLPDHVTSPTVLVSVSPEEILKRQVERFVDLGYKKAYFEKVKLPKSVFALLVVPQNLVPLKTQMERAGLEVDRENIYGWFADPFRSAQGPYWIYDIETMSFEPKYTPNSFMGELQRRGKRGLTFNEGVNLFAQHPGFFLKTEHGNCHGFSFFGSRAKVSDPVPDITLFDCGIGRGIVIGPNSYHGDKGNYDTAVICKRE